MPSSEENECEEGIKSWSSGSWDCDGSSNSSSSEFHNEVNEVKNIEETDETDDIDRIWHSDKETMEESLGYNSNPSATTDTDEFLYEENKCNENTEPYQSNCSDGSNSIDNLEIKESKHKDLPIKVVGYYKNKSLLDAAKDKTINSVKKIKNKFNF